MAWQFTLWSSLETGELKNLQILLEALKVPKALLASSLRLSLPRHKHHFHLDFLEILVVSLHIFNTTQNLLTILTLQ